MRPQMGLKRVYVCVCVCVRFFPPPIPLLGYIASLHHFPSHITTQKLCLTYALISSSSSSINQSYESIAAHSPLKHFPSKAVTRILFMPPPVHIWSMFLTCPCSPSTGHSSSYCSPADTSLT